MLQTRTVEPGTLKLLERLMSEPELDSFYLVGGTALALQLGHRTSIDLDPFTPVSFDKSLLIESLDKRFTISIVSESDSMVISYIEGVKVDFVKMGYPILFPLLIEQEIRMLDIKDIAPMKLKAITQRGSKKDFYDIYFLLQQMPLEIMLKLFKEQFKQYEIFHVVKSLTYFEDAEHYADPLVFDQKVT